MVIMAILTLSIVLQVLAALLALRLIRLTGARLAWVLIAASLVLMALRRTVALYQFVLQPLSTPVALLEESISLVISLFILLGIAGIAPLFLKIRDAEEALRLNESRLEALWRLGQMQAASLQEIASFTLEEAVSLTKSDIGFVGFLDREEKQLSIQAWSQRVMAQCAVRQQPIIYPLAQAGLWGEAVRRRQPVIINDYGAGHPWKKGVPEGHVALNRLLIIPVLDNSRVVVVAAVGNKNTDYDDGDVRQLTLLMQGMWWLRQRQQAEAALTAEIERMHEFQARLIQISTDGIIANDRQGNIILYNEGAEKILGYRPEEVMGRLPVARLYPPGEARKIKKLIHRHEFGGPGRLVHYETVVLDKSGQEIPIELSASLIRQDSQEMAVVGFFRDLRERRHLQEKLMQSERLAVLGRMAAHLGHEIKNPLMVIGGFARQVRDHLHEEPETNRGKLEIIIKEIARLEEFLTETGGYARLSEPHKVMGEVNALLRETCALLEPSLAERGVDLRLHLSDPLPRLAYDPIHLRQVFLNLLKNSLEAMPRGGVLTVASRITGDRLLVEIADTGEGMTPEVREKIFQPFFSTKPKGSGLGLAICQKIMEAHRGDIRIDSTPGQGTRVTLALPAPSRP